MVLVSMRVDLMMAARYSGFELAFSLQFLYDRYHGSTNSTWGF
jgi:hypothetical protein